MSKKSRRRSRAPEEMERLRSLAAPLAEPIEEPEDYESTFDYKLGDLHSMAYAVLSVGGASLMDELSKVPNLFETELPKLFDNGKRLLQDMKESLEFKDYSVTPPATFRANRATIKAEKWDEMSEGMRTLAPYTKVTANGRGDFTLAIPAMGSNVKESRIPGFSVPEMLDAIGICVESRIDMAYIVPRVKILQNAMVYLPPEERSRMQTKVDALMTSQLELLKTALGKFMEDPLALDDMTRQMRLRIPVNFKSALNSPFIDKEILMGENDFAFEKDGLKELVGGLNLLIEVSPPRGEAGVQSINEVSFINGTGTAGKMPYVRRTLGESVMYCSFANQQELDVLRKYRIDDLDYDNNWSDVNDSMVAKIIFAYSKEDKPSFQRVKDEVGGKILERLLKNWNHAYRGLDGNLTAGAPEEPTMPTAPVDFINWLLENTPMTRLNGWLTSNKMPVPPSLQTDVVDKADYKDAMARLKSRSFMCRLSNIGEAGDAEVVAFSEFTISEDVAAFVTQHSPPAPVDVAEWAYQMTDAQYSFAKTDASFYRAVGKAIADTRAMPQRSRLNGDQMMVGPDADLVFVPTADPQIVTQYEKAIEDSYRGAFADNEYTRQDVGMGNVKAKFKDVEGQETPEISIQNQYMIPENAKTDNLVIKQFAQGRLRSYYIFTDWGADILSYTTASGGLVTADVSAYSPASVMEYQKSMEEKVNPKALSFGYLRNSLTAWLNYKGKKVTDYFEDGDFEVPGAVTDVLGESVKDFLFPVGGNPTIHEVLASIQSLAKRLVDRDIATNDYPFEEVYKDLRISHLTADSDIPMLRGIGRIAVEAMQDGADSLFKVLSDPKAIGTSNVLSVTSRMQGVASIFAMAKYAEQSAKDELKSQVAAKQAKYSLNPVKVNDETEVAPVPFIRPDFSALAHQIRAIVSGQRQPDKKVDHVDAGGGKTLMNVLDCLYTLGQYYERGDLKGNQQKRPLMMCPKNLIKNYIEDITYLTQGAVNVVVLSTDVINRYGHDYMYNLIYNAPINTLVLCDFDFPKNGQYSIQYGNTDLILSNNSELMRRFEWIYLSMDESQYLANLDSARSASVRAQATLSDNLRQTTGTYVHGQLTDAAGQFSIMSPSTFGSKKDFIERYAAETFQGKPLSWKNNAERDVRNQMNSAADYVRVSRREWAALLPAATETFHKVSLSKKQMAVYQDILNDAVEAIMADADLMKKLKASDEGEENVANIEMLLRPYLQRLEMFISAPAHDKVGDKVLQGSDRISPKAKEIIRLFDEHSKDKTNGKVLIFCAYVASAQALHASLPPDLQKKVILYYAADKDKLLPKFEKDDGIIGLIGVETSLNTGHNFQFVNRLISTDSVWSPGEFEQGQSRLNRPDPKNKYGKRNKIFFDRIIADGTIDVTKTARMMSKLLTMVRFQASDARYDKLPNLPLVSMTLDSIMDANKFGSEDDQGSLFAYVDAYGQYTKIRRDEYADFLKTYDGPTKAKEIPTAGNLPGSALITVPYTSNQQLPFTDALGIIPVADWLADNDLTADDADMKGLQVHTEYGDGEVISSGKNTLKVKIKEIGTVSVNKLAVFVILKPNKVPVRQRLAEMVGMPERATQYSTPESDPVVEEPEEDDDTEEPEEQTAPEPEVPVKKAVVERNRDLDGEIYVYPGVLNNMIQLALDREDPDVTDKMATQLGFRETGKFIYAIVPTYRALSSVIDKLKENFEVQPRYLKDLESALAAFTQGKRRLLNFEAALDTDVRNFHLDRKRAVPKGELRPYVMFYEGECWILVDMTKQPSAVQVRRKVIVPTVKWESSDSEWFILSNSKAEAKAELDAIVRSGVSIANYDEVMETIKSLTLRTKKRTPAAKVNTEVTGKTIRRFQTKSGTRFIALVKTKDGYVLETQDGNTDLGKVSEAAAGRALAKAVKAETKWKLREVA
ncbi:DNA helicase [Pseudomonas phage vB_PpuM-Illi-2]